MSSIYLDTFTHRVRKHEKYEYIGRLGGDEHVQYDPIEKKIYASEFILSLLLHDIIYVNIDSLEDVVLLLGIESTSFLLRERVLIIVDDGGTRVAFLPNDGNNLLMNFSSSTEYQFDQILNRLLKNYQGNHKRQAIKPLILNAEKNSFKLDGAWLGHLVNKEVLYDMENKRIRESLGFNHEYSNTIVKDEDVTPTMRLSLINKSVIYQNTLNANYVLSEGEAQNILGLKLGPFLSQTVTEPLNLFRSILKDKHIPDLSLFYLEDLITMEEIITMRNSVYGKKFREWLDSTEYNRDQVYKEMLASVKSRADSIYIKFARWATPNLLGLMLPPVAFVASVADSFLVDKMLKGWHPNLFLDNILDERIKRMDNSKQKNLSQQREEKIFGRKIGRNENCVCDSGKKYKNCCGK